MSKRHRHTLDIKHNASASKDRTSQFMGKPEFRISVETGKQIKAWCNESTVPLRIPTNEEILKRVNEYKSLDELLSLYNLHPDKQKVRGPEFTKKRQQLVLQNNDSKTISQQQNLATNGTPINQ